MRKSILFRTLFALGLTFSVVGGERSAEADQSAAAPDPAVEAHYNAGVAIAKKAVTQRDWENACEEFKKAFDLEKNPQIAANFGHAELKAGRWRSAAEHLEFFLREEKDASDGARKEIEALLKDAQKNIVTITIEVDQVGAEVWIDGKQRGISPLGYPIFLEENSHEFEVRKAGMRADKQSDVFKRGEGRTIKFKMVVDPMASVGPTKKVDKGKEPKWRTGLTVGFSIFAAVGIGAGVITGIKYWNHPGRNGSNADLNKLADDTPDNRTTCWENSYEKNAIDCATQLENAQRADVLGASSIVAFSVGGAAILGLITTRLYPPNGSPKTQLKPMVGSTMAGLIITRDF